MLNDPDLSRLSLTQIEGVFKGLGEPRGSNSIFRFHDWHGDLTPRLYRIRVGPPVLRREILVDLVRREISDFLFSKGATRDTTAKILNSEEELCFKNTTERPPVNDSRLSDPDSRSARGAARRFIISEMLAAGFDRNIVELVFNKYQEWVHRFTKHLRRETQEALTYGFPLPKDWPIQPLPGPLKAMGILPNEILNRLRTVLNPEEDILSPGPTGLTETQILNYKMRISCFLTAHGLPQEQAAEMLGVPLSTITQWKQNLDPKLDASIGRSATLSSRQQTEGCSLDSSSQSKWSALRRVVLMALLQSQPAAKPEDLQKLLGVHSAIDLQQLIRLAIRELSALSV